MKTKFNYSLYFLFLTLLLTQADASVTLKGTRVIFPTDSASKTIQFDNSDNQPTIIQLQMVKADNTLDNDTPFAISQSLFRMEPHSQQLVNIINTKKRSSGDKESLFYLQFKQYPAIKKSDIGVNKLLITLISKVKVYYRPPSLMNNSNSDPASKIKFEINDSSLKLINPTGFFISIVKIKIQSSGTPYETNQYYLLAPFSTLTESLPKSLAKPLAKSLTPITIPKVELYILNDSGALREIRL